MESEEKVCSVLEKMGWTWEPSRIGRYREWSKPGQKVKINTPPITHEFCSEVWDWMKVNMTEDQAYDYEHALYEAALTLRVGNSLFKYSVMAHLPAEQDFLCQCQALGIE